MAGNIAARVLIVAEMIAFVSGPSKEMPVVTGVGAVGGAATQSNI
jgi:hypothetical protein